MTDSPSIGRIVLRSLLIQGSWNPRTMLGGGVAWALAPTLRKHLPPADVPAALERAGEHFNAHPYLAGVALGAATRLEVDSEDPAVIRRFRDALRGPLGALGDSAIWAGLRPVLLLLALALGLAGLPPLAVVTIFLLTYNIPHLFLRWWGVKSGLALGRHVGDRIRQLNLPSASARLGRMGIFLLGLLAGWLSFVGSSLISTSPAWMGGIPALLLLGWGWSRGVRVRALVPWGTLLLIAGLLAFAAPASGAVHP